MRKNHGENRSSMFFFSFFLVEIVGQLSMLTLSPHFFLDWRYSVQYSVEGGGVPFLSLSQSLRSTINGARTAHRWGPEPDPQNGFRAGVSAFT